MAYLFNKDCEIMNCEFVAGEVIDEASITFYPTVMSQSDKQPTHWVKKVGDTLTKWEITEGQAEVNQEDQATTPKQQSKKWK